jgi:membrane protease YdiL (CAAX protease family)
MLSSRGSFQRHQLINVPERLPRVAGEFAVLCCVVALIDPYVGSPFNAAGFPLGWMAVVGCVVVVLARLWVVPRSQLAPTVLLWAVVLFLAAQFSTEFGFAAAAVVAASAVSEEIAYRVCMTNTVASLLSRRGVHWWTAWWAAAGIASVIFVLQPGHIQQFSSPLTVVVFAAFAVALSAVYAATQNLPLAGGLHAGMNLVSYPIILGGGSSIARVFWLVLLMGCVFWAIVNEKLSRGVTPPPSVLARHNAALRRRGIAVPVPAGTEPEALQL